MTFADITKGHSNITSQTLTKSFTMPVVTKEELLKIHICIAHAHQKDVENPGTYGEELNKVLVANCLPKIIIPDDSNKVHMQKEI